MNIITMHAFSLFDYYVGYEEDSACECFGKRLSSRLPQTGPNDDRRQDALPGPYSDYFHISLVISVHYHCVRIHFLPLMMGEFHWLKRDNFRRWVGCCLLVKRRKCMGEVIVYALSVLFEKGVDFTNNSINFRLYNMRVSTGMYFQINVNKCNWLNATT